MTCYSGFGNLTDGKHRMWVDGFGAGGGKQILFYYEGDHNWWLGTSSGGTIAWELVGNTAGFGNLNDGRPIWTGYFSNLSRAEILFYYPGDHNWWLGSFSGNQLTWRLVGNTAGFGNLALGAHRFWIDDFNADARSDVLFYYEGDHNWWLGSISAGQLVWRFAGNTAGFGNLNDGRPLWAGYFNGVFRADMLFYYPGDSNWWLGTYNGSVFQWQHVGNTAGFGNLHDGRPIWTGNFKIWHGGTDILFYYPGDSNWWLGSISGGQLTWNFAGNTAGFGQVWDGRPFWIGDFNGDGQMDVLFYFPGDQNWWLGTILGTQLSWSLAGNTAGFGQVWDGRPFWIGDFNRDGKADVLFYFPGDGNWWLGAHNGNRLQWSFAGNTGRPCSQQVTVHFKSLLPINNAINNFIDTQFLAMEDLFSQRGVLVRRGTTEDLSANQNLQQFLNLNVGQCLMGQPNQAQNTLYANRNNVGNNELVIYIVQTLPGLTAAGAPTNFLGCAVHPVNQPGAAVVQSAAQWLVAHEVGHVLDLRHVPTTPATNTDSLMWPNVGWTNVPPDLSAAEGTTMLNSAFTINC